jgi:hypothetical protein
VDLGTIRVQPLPKKMRKKGRVMRSFIILALLCFLILPIAVFAQTHISASIPGTNANSTSSAPGAFIANFYQFALMIGGILAFGVIVFGGIKYMASAGNPSGQTDGKEWIWGALTGLLLLAGAYLVLHTINPQLVNLNLPTLNQVVATAPYTATSSTPTATSTASGIPAKIAAAAAAYKGTSTANGPGNGTVACAWSVNNVLTNAGVANLDSTSVQSLENSITAGRGTLVDSSAAVAGDIVIQAGDGHVGICQNTGCTQVLSNSSSKATFSWISNTSFTPSYSGGPGRIYQINS